MKANALQSLLKKKDICHEVYLIFKCFCINKRDPNNVELLLGGACGGVEGSMIQWYGLDSLVRTNSLFFLHWVSLYLLNRSTLPP